jgi:hypothetical protein
MEKQRERQEKGLETLTATADFVGAMGAVFDQVAQSIEEEGKNADGWRKAQGLAMGIMYTIKAIAAAAEMGMAIASQNYAGAIAAGSSIVTFGLAAAMSYSKLAQTGGGGAPAAAATGRFTPSALPSASGEAPGSGEINVKLYSLGFGDSDVAASMEKANWNMLRSGRVARRPGRSVGFSG